MFCFCLFQKTRQILIFLFCCFDFVRFVQTKIIPSSQSIDIEKLKHYIWESLIGDTFYVSNWRQYRHGHPSHWVLVLSWDRASRSEVEHSTYWAKPAAVINRCYKLIVTFPHAPGTHSGWHGTAKQGFWSNVGFDPGQPEAVSYLPGFSTFFLQDACLVTTPWPHVVEHELQLVMCHLSQREKKR